MQRRIIEFEFLQTVAQTFVLVGLGRVQTRKHLGLYFFKPGQGRSRSRCSAATTLLDQSNRVADFRSLQLTNTRNDVTHLTSLQGITRLVGWGKNAEVVCVVHGPGGHHFDALALGQTPIDDPHQHHHANVAVKPTVNNHGPQRARRIAFGRRNFGDNRF